MRALLIVLGIVFTVIGVVGIAVPLIPGLLFLLVAAFFFWNAWRMTRYPKK